MQNSDEELVKRKDAEGFLFKNVPLNNKKYILRKKKKKEREREKWKREKKELREKNEIGK